MTTATVFLYRVMAAGFVFAVSRIWPNFCFASWAEKKRMGEFLRSARRGAKIFRLFNRSGRAQIFFKGAAICLLAAGCVAEDRNDPGADRQFTATTVAQLPAPHANNAVASIDTDEGLAFYSFNGLRSGKTYTDVSKQAFKCTVAPSVCVEIEGPPVSQGRLASIAVTLGSKIYLFGGYTVAEDDSEVSTPEVFAFDPARETYARLADMPTPVDDTVAVVHADRYIYLVSGWHDTANVNLVQVYDIVEDRWFDATPFPGVSVFGHAGGVVGGKMVIADGVGLVETEDGERRFANVAQAWLGTIDSDDPANIDWRQLPEHPGEALYRMAATGDPDRDRVVFFGGGDNAYNYNGIGYDGVPANPSNRLFSFNRYTDEWEELGNANRATMDHRGLMIGDGAYWVLGGMNEDRDVMGELLRIELK